MVTERRPEKSLARLLISPGPIRQLVGRAIALTSILGNIQIVFIVYLVHRFVPILDSDFFPMVKWAFPYVSVLFLVFFLWLFYYSRPLISFLLSVENGKEQTEERVRFIQERCLRLPYVTAIVAPPFYVIGGLLTGYVVYATKDCFFDVIYYAMIAGGLSSFLITPVLVLCFHWFAEPVVALASESVPGLEPARHAGFKSMTIRRKLIVAMFTLVVATTGYVVLIGYGQSDIMLDNMRLIEANLPPSVKADMAAKGVSFAGDFEARWGNLAAVYATLMIIACMEALIVAALASREVVGPIKLLAGAADKIRKGGYDDPVRLVNDDESTILAAAVNRMMATILGHVRDMEAVIEELRHGIARMDETAGELKEVSLEQSSGATQQAGAIQEASSIAEEIVATARQIAERARSVDDVASNTLESVRSGESKLADALEAFKRVAEQSELTGGAMRRLEDRFQETYRIVEMIKDVADRTELLSLNASLEAAGAGGHGRRFAVVAAETRRLAIKSEEATEEIMSLVRIIEDATLESTRLAEEGKVRVTEGGMAIHEVVEALNTISRFAESTSSSVNEITLTTSHQTTASEQLAASVSEVHEVAIQIEEGAKRVENQIANLRDFAEALRKTVEGKGNGAAPGSTSHQARETEH